MTAVPGLDRIQPFDPLDAATEAALRASIERFGVIVPVVKDQHGRILDGHHRDRIATELGKTYEERVYPVTDENDAREIARTLNADRRQLTAEQRKLVVSSLREGGHSYRAIARAINVDHKTVWNDAHATVEDSPVEQPQRIVGLDGKSRPSARTTVTPVPPVPNRRGTYYRPDKTASFELNTETARLRSESEARKIVDGLSHISGICHGFAGVDYGMAAATLTADDLRGWAAKAGELSKALRLVRNQLTEVTNAQ